MIIYQKEVINLQVNKISISNKVINDSTRWRLMKDNSIGDGKKNNKTINNRGLENNTDKKLSFDEILEQAIKKTR